MNIIHIVKVITHISTAQSTKSGTPTCVSYIQFISEIVPYPNFQSNGWSCDLSHGLKCPMTRPHFGARVQFNKWYMLHCFQVKHQCTWAGKQALVMCRVHIDSRLEKQTTKDQMHVHTQGPICYAKPETNFPLYNMCPFLPYFTHCMP